MVKRSDIMPVILRACPSVETRWAEYRADSEFDPELDYLTGC